MKRLFIAEKSSLAQAVMAILPGTAQRQGGASRMGDDLFVPLAGHILEQAMPDAYLPDDVPRSKTGGKVWRAEDLPVVPPVWILEPRASGKTDEDRARDRQANAAKLEAIAALLKTVDEVVHLGDPDEEGQLLVDEVLLHLGNTKPVRRMLVNDYNATKVREALANLRDNDEPTFRGWYRWALARQRYDWLLGLNGTRAATLRARELGFDGVLPVGSVQTPALKLVDDRCRAIQTFKPVPYFTLTATLQHANGAFVARWQPADEQAGLDETGRLVDGAVAHALVAHLTGQSATIASYEQAPKREHPPLPLSLNELTVAVCGKYGVTAEAVLDAAQVLYERYKVTSYPRTENRYLSEAQHTDAPAVIAALGQNLPGLGGLIAKADMGRKSAAFDDKKMDGNPHHGIVPTVATADLSKLTELERNVYELIVRSYLAQFFEPAVFLQTKIEARIDGERFTAGGKTLVSAGWREVYAVQDESTAAAPAEETDDGKQTLPAMAEGDATQCVGCEAKPRETKPPAYFDEASLIDAMIDLHKYTTDPAAKARLKAGKGIGTSATRAGIVKELRERGLIEPVKGSKTRIQTSASGRGLLAALPMPVKDPTMAGVFKLTLDAVATGEITDSQFLERTVAFVTKVVQGLRTAPMTLPGTQVITCPQCKTGVLRRIRTESGHFWGCSQFKAEPACKASYPDADGQPDFRPKTTGKGKGFGFKKGW
jgi:DNA topoisomerase-3